MSKTYGELDLKKIREECGLDFAHFTYKRNQCSCCYTPKDLPKRYWHKGIIPDGDDYTYILFKNAYNGSGAVTKNDIIENYTCVSWNMSEEQLDKVCDMLQEQLGNDYYVQKPNDKYTTIIIWDSEIWENKNREDF